MNESETDWLHFSQNAYLKQTHIHTHTLCPKEHSLLPRGEGLSHMFWKIIKLECFPTQQSFRPTSFFPFCLPFFPNEPIPFSLLKDKVKPQGMILMHWAWRVLGAVYWGVPLPPWEARFLHSHMGARLVEGFGKWQVAGLQGGGGLSRNTDSPVLFLSVQVRVCSLEKSFCPEQCSLGLAVLCTSLWQHLEQFASVLLRILRIPSS